MDELLCLLQCALDESGFAAKIDFDKVSESYLI